MWVHDLLPDGAAESDVLEEGTVLRLSRALERRAYASAAQVVTISDGTRDKIIAKGVPAEKVHRMYNPAPRRVEPFARAPVGEEACMLYMGNIGLARRLAEVVEVLRRSEVLEQLDARLAIAGDGVEAEEVRSRIGPAPIDMLGVLHGPEVDSELARSTIGLITQRDGTPEFNFPSRMMHFFVRGVPVVASVAPDSETARVIEASGGGWVTDSGRLEDLPHRLREILADRDEVERRARAAYDYAVEHFDEAVVSRAFERVLLLARDG